MEEHTRWMTRGARDLAAGRYEDAVKAYGEAVKLRPDDADAVKGLVEAKTSALAAAATSAKTKEEQEKRRAEVARLLGEGKEAMERKQYAAAVQALTAAQKLDPENADVRKALEEALAAADADAGEKKKLAEYRTHMEAGRAAMTAQRFEDAVREFGAALKLLPGDATAQINLQTAQNRVAGLADAQKRQAAHADLIQQAQAALAARRLDEVVRLLEAARRLAPDDKGTQKALKAAKLELANAQEEYKRLLDQGDLALVRRRFEEAQRLYEQAAQVLPGDPAAPAKAQVAANARTDQAAALVAYQRFMTLAALDMDNQRYASAVRNYQEALRLVPGDLSAVQGLRDARAALQPPPLLVEPQPGRQPSQARYNNAMTQGRAALAANRPQEAMRWFEAALQEAPGDPAATALLQQARIRRRP
jgi:tetratricopeptide (TPR) repeat protein